MVVALYGLTAKTRAKAESMEPDGIGFSRDAVEEINRGEKATPCSIG